MQGAGWLGEPKGLLCKGVKILVCITLPSQAKRDAAIYSGSRGNALSRGPLPRFLRSIKRGHKALTLHSAVSVIPTLLVN
jgi:hypothetical protein